MKPMTYEEALRASRHADGPCVSLYIAPRDRVRPLSGIARLSALLAVAARRLEAALGGRSSRLAERFLEPVAGLARRQLRRQGEGGLAIFHSRGVTGYIELPEAVPELVVVAASFHVKPLLRFAREQREAHVLAVRRGSVDLYLTRAADMRLLTSVPVPKALQLAAANAAILQSRRSAGAAEDERLDDLAATVARRVAGTRRAASLPPLIVVGRDALADVVYARVRTTGADVAFLSASPDRMSLPTLADEARALAHPHFEAARRAELEGVGRAAAAGALLIDLHEIARAVVAGRVRTLVVAHDRHVWGTLDRVSGRIRLVEHDGRLADDLLDDLAEEVLARGGRVIAASERELPSAQPAVAVIRQEAPRQVFASRLELPAG